MIETERLYLRQWKPSDFADFALMNADPQVMAFFPRLLEVEQSMQLAQQIMDDIQAQGWGFWAVEIKATSSFAGFVGLGIPKVDLPFSPCVEIAWRLMAKYWGKGYATEAADAVLDFAFNLCISMK